MKTYNNIEEVKKDIKDGVLRVDDDIEIAFDGFEIEADIECHKIYSKGYRRNITAGNIDASDITAENINAGNINAWNIDAWNINAWNINALDILYYAVCFAYENIVCTSIKGRRENAKHFCLDGEIKIKEPAETITIAGHTYNKKEVEEALQDIKLEEIKSIANDVVIESHIFTLTAYKERLEGKKKEAASKDEIDVLRTGYNQALTEEISYLEEVISKLK